MHRPSWKTINERFKKLVLDHREAITNNRATSVIEEVREEIEVLLYDIFLAVDEMEEQSGAERDSRKDLYRRILASWEEIR